MHPPASHSRVYLTVLGTLKAGGVSAPLPAGLDADSVRDRLSRSRARVLVTDCVSYSIAVAPHRDVLLNLEHVIITDSEERGCPRSTMPWSRALMAGAAAYHPQENVVAPTWPDDPALLHFTSEASGRPTGTVQVHEAILAHHVTAQFALDLRPGDVYWCTADPGSVTGTVYGILGPLSCGVTVVADSAAPSDRAAAGGSRDVGPDARRIQRLLEDERVSVFATTAASLQTVIDAGAAFSRELAFPALRHVVNLGGPLDAESVCRGAETFGVPVHDTWSQPQTGAIVVSNFPGMPVRPGSIGRPVPAIDVAVLGVGEDGRVAVADGHVTVLERPDEVGELALRPGWPSLFRTCLDDPEGHARAFADGWYLSGELARIDADGYVWLIPRAGGPQSSAPSSA